MQQLEGKTAIVTGAASGIGLGLARTLRARGHVGRAVRHPRRPARCGARRGARARRQGDRGRRPTCRTAPRCARRAKPPSRQFGALHVACNNAGITIHGRSVAELTPQEWEWNIGVNFYGVVHGLEVFLPLIRQHGGEGHIVNTASIAGFQIGGHRRSGSYGAMKFAVVALSESIAHDLKDSPIGVSVLAPAAVKTRIYTSGENRPARFGGPYRGAGQQSVPERARRRAGAGRGRRARGARDPQS